MHDWNRIARLKGGLAFGARTDEGIGTVRLPSSIHAGIASLPRQPDRIRFACDVNGSSGARGQAHDTDNATPTRTDQRRGRLDIFHIIGAR